jgi:aminoglycoside phosphotransferase (APT) family kinase protein
MKLHEDEVDIDVTIVRTLLQEQYPLYLSEKLTFFESMGTENVMFSLGEDKLIRLPRVEGAVNSLKKEAKWLSVLRRNLKVPIPKVLFEGKPSDSYPFPWLVISKLEGAEISNENPIASSKTSRSLADFIFDLRLAPTKKGPLCSRGLPLAKRDKAVRESILLLEGSYDTKLLTDLWEDSLKASAWQNEPLWLHGDLHKGNLLAKDSEISAILDFGLSGIGDPSCDLMAAWTVLEAKSRREFFSFLSADDNSIRKARGWALSLGILGYPYYKETNPSFALLAKNAMDEVISDPF